MVFFRVVCVATKGIEIFPCVFTFAFHHCKSTLTRQERRSNYKEKIQGSCFFFYVEAQRLFVILVLVLVSRILVAVLKRSSQLTECEFQSDSEWKILPLFCVLFQ